MEDRAERRSRGDEHRQIELRQQVVLGVLWLGADGAVARAHRRGSAEAPGHNARCRSDGELRDGLIRDAERGVDEERSVHVDERVALRCRPTVHRRRPAGERRVGSPHADAERQLPHAEVVAVRERRDRERGLRELYVGERGAPAIDARVVRTHQREGCVEQDLAPREREAGWVHEHRRRVVDARDEGASATCRADAAIHDEEPASARRRFKYQERHEEDGQRREERLVHGATVRFWITA